MTAFMKILGTLLLTGVLYFGSVDSANAKGPGHDHLPPAPTDQAAPLEGKTRGFHGDRPLRAIIILTATETLGTDRAAIREAIGSGKSLIELASEYGVSEEELLAEIDARIERWADRAVERGRLTPAMRDGRVAYYQKEAALMIVVPGWSPVYPGLHELHVMSISGAVDATGLRRHTIRHELHRCRTLDDILVEAGSSGEAAIDSAMAKIDAWLNAEVAAGHLANSQSAEWRASILSTFEGYIHTPGVHVAGQECSA